MLASGQQQSMGRQLLPKTPDGKRNKFNVYAKTREECEVLLAEMIPKVKAEIAETEAKL